MSLSRHASSWKVIAVTVMAALALGGAWLGFYYGGSQPEEASSVSGQNAASGTGNAADQRPGLKDRLGRFLATGDEGSLDDLLPEGITEISGRGGRGLHRQVRSHGHWFPVFDLSKVADADSADPSQVGLNKVPLMILTPHPPGGKINEVLNHRFTAVGGRPPYSWSLEAEGDLKGFLLDAQSGNFSGVSEVPLKLPVNVYVTDMDGAQASAATTLIIADEEPLQILTMELPAAMPGQAYTATLNASGGAMPYVWTLVSGPAGWTCDRDSGAVSGLLETAGEHELQIMVSDSITQVTRTFTLVAEGGLSILTPTLLPPAAPGAPYRGTFEAEGGSLPYRWTLTKGEIPSGWSLDEAGNLNGVAPVQEWRYEFEIQVTDSTGLTFSKTFQMPVSNGLLVVPSRQKAGLAWQYEMMTATLGTQVSGVSLKRDGMEIYRGQGTNVVDRNLVTGKSYSYELTAIATNGSAIPYAAAVTTIRPMALKRAQEGTSGDPFADKVVVFNPLAPGAYGVGNMPSNVTGPPDGNGTYAPAFQPNQVLSLHASSAGGGHIVLEFSNNIVEAGTGPDFTVFENVLFRNNDPNQRFMEPATVEVALFEGQWHRFPFRVNPGADGTVDLTQPAYYAQGFAGVNATTGDDPTDPSRSGGDTFDTASLGRPDLQWFRYIRLTATGDGVLRDGAGKAVRHTSENNSLSGNGSSGFDLDAVTTVNY